MTDIILSVLTALLGGTNIIQFFLLRQEKRKAAAEADGMQTDSNRKKYELSKDQADFLIESLDKVNREYVVLQQNIRESEASHTQAILDKCKMIAELRSQVVYHKEFRCYKMDCSSRERTKSLEQETTSQVNAD